MYRVGQRIPIWLTRDSEAGTECHVLKEVIVTVEEVTHEEGTCLLGRGDDGKDYEKHCHEGQEPEDNSLWKCCEAGKMDVEVYYEAILLLDSIDPVLDHKTGRPMVPGGDVIYCRNHQKYCYSSVGCLDCGLDETIIWKTE